MDISDAHTMIKIIIMESLPEHPYDDPVFVLSNGGLTLSYIPVLGPRSLGHTTITIVGAIMPSP